MKKAKTQSNRRTRSSVKPPQWSGQLTFTRKQRYISAANQSSKQVQYQDLADAYAYQASLGGLLTTSVRLASSYRLRKVEVWASMASNLTPVTCSIEWGEVNTAQLGAPAKVISDSSAGFAPAHIKCRPAPMSKQAMWQSCALNDAGVVFYLTCPTGSIIDVTLDIVVSIDGTVNQTANTINPSLNSTGTFGLFSLDGAATQLLPVTTQSMS
jgi:hypothetical protein